MSAARPRPLVIAILDGLGAREDRDANAIAEARTPNLESLAASPRALLAASGAAVGLPARRPGDGEAGHRAIGAGRVAPPHRARIDAAVDDKKVILNEVIASAVRIAKHHHEARLHLFTLLSDLGGHASAAHLYAVIDAADFDDVPVVVHAFLDDRDARTPAGDRLEELQMMLGGGKKGVIGTLAGRAFALDAGGRWDRLAPLHRAIVRGQAPRAETAIEALNAAYADGKTGATLEPIRIGDYEGIKGSFMADFTEPNPIWCWFGEENGLALNLRPDTMSELAAALLRRGVPAEVERDLLTERGKPIFAFGKGSFAALTDLGGGLDVPVAYPRAPLTGTLGEAIAEAGLTQLRVARADRRAHVTTFFGGDRREPLAGEDREILPLPAPASEVAARAAEAITAGRHDVIVVHLGDADLAAATGSMDDAILGVEAVDAALGLLLSAVKAAGGVLAVTSDHGNAERMKDMDGRRLGAPTDSPVPFWIVNGGERAATLRDGGLADVAPTLLALLGLPQPAAMTGRSLLAR